MVLYYRRLKIEMKDKEPILTLVKDPLESWELSVDQLISSYYECLKNPNLNFLGYKSNVIDFTDKKPSELDLLKSKFFNLYSEISNNPARNQNLIEDFSGVLFTHDLTLHTMPNLVLQKFKKNLSKTLGIMEENIKITFIEANVTLLAHKDDNYFKKTKNLHPSMKVIKDAMITESALNWNLLGKESKFRIIDKDSQYTNHGLGELSFFNPCKYKHGTSDNVHRLTLTARFFNINHNDVWNSINKNLQIVDINPCK